MKNYFFSFILIITIIVAQNAPATITTFNNEAEFLAAVGTTVFENFETLPTTYPTQFTTITTSNFDVTTIPTSGGTSWISIGASHPFPTDGVNCLVAGSDTYDSFNLVFSLHFPVSVVGFYVTDFQGNGGTLSLQTGAGDTLLIASGTFSGNELFFGMIDDTNSFDNFTIIQESIADGIGVDQIYLKTCTDSDLDGYHIEGEACGEIDCDDTNFLINPSVSEVCNGIDDNCDGNVDEGVTITYYLDTDIDGYGDPTNPTQACSTPSGYVTNNSDCDDSDASVNPDGIEVCSDLKDNDCDGSPDCVDNECSTDIACIDCTDSDGDSYSIEGGACGPVDCDDANLAINPGATETCNEIDDNCSGFADEGVTTTFYFDSDGDGFGDLSTPTQACFVPSGYVANNSDCNDIDILISPAADEICSDTIDNDCDGLSDCDDTNCVGDPVCSSGDGSSGGCSFVNTNKSIEDATSVGLILLFGLMFHIGRRIRKKRN